MVSSGACRVYPAHSFRWFAAVCAIVLFHAETCALAAARDERPNILFVLSDDQSWLHTGATGDPVVQTPAFDRIAAEGVLFTHAFTACPSCTASRGAILSGQDIWRIGQAGVLYGSVPADLPLYPLLLEDAGYFIGYTGKGWVPGDPHALGQTRYPMGREFNVRLEGTVATGIDRRDYAANFADFLAARPEGKPFCFWFGATEPHRVYQQGMGQHIGLNPDGVQVPAFWPDVPDVRGDILDYYYEIQWFDSHLESMIAQLEELGELDCTLIVVTSDNGMPFPRAKTTLYDWGTRMPLAIRWADEVPGGRVVDDFVCHTDFAPTFLDAAGVVAPEEMTGCTLLPILRSDREGSVEVTRNRVFTASERHTWCRPGGATYPMRSLRNREFLYIRNFTPDRWPTGGPTFLSSNRTFHGDVDACPTRTFMLEPDNQERYPEQYELCFGRRPPEELYDVRTDPAQVKNLAHDPQYESIRKQLAEELTLHLVRTGDPRINDQDPWQDYIYHQTDGFGAVYNRSLPSDVRARASLRPGN